MDRLPTEVHQPFGRLVDALDAVPFLSVQGRIEYLELADDHRRLVPEAVPQEPVQHREARVVFPEVPELRDVAEVDEPADDVGP